MEVGARGELDGDPVLPLPGGTHNLANQYDMPLLRKTYEEGRGCPSGARNKRRHVPRRHAGAVVLIGEAHDELARVEREGARGVEILAAVVGRESHSEVGRAVEADQLRHYGPVHGPRAHLRRDLHLQNHTEKHKGVAFRSQLR